MADFAQQLRALRDQAGGGAARVAEISSREGLPRSTLFAALQGKRLPSRRVVSALARAWGGDEADWLAKRSDAETAATIDSVDAVRMQVRQLHRALGAPTTTALEAAAEGEGVVLSPLDIDSLLTATGGTPPWELVERFVKACAAYLSDTGGGIDVDIASLDPQWWRETYQDHVRDRDRRRADRLANGAARFSQRNPFDLGVRRTASRELSGDPNAVGLPAYVRRRHDDELERQLRVDNTSRMIALVGQASSGKSRALYEAVRSNPAIRTWVTHAPTTAADLVALLTYGRVQPRSILWLDDCRRHLDGPDGEKAASALYWLLDSPVLGPVVVLGTLDPRDLLELTSQPPRDGPDIHGQTRALLTRLAVRIAVSDTAYPSAASQIPAVEEPGSGRGPVAQSLGQPDHETPDPVAALAGPDAADALRRWAESINAVIRPVFPTWDAGGHAGSKLFAIEMIRPPAGPVKLIVKVVPRDRYGQERVRPYLAMASAPTAFADNHLIRPLHDPLPTGDGGALIVQEPPTSWPNVRTAAELPIRFQADVCRDVTRAILHDWNGRNFRLASATAAEYIASELPGGFDLDSSLREGGALSETLRTETFWITTEDDESGGPLPNPLLMATDRSLLGNGAVQFLIGRAHGDLHLGNVLVPVTPAGPQTRQFQLVDLSTFESGAPLTRDPVTITLALIAEHLADLTQSQQSVLMDLLTTGRSAHQHLSADPVVEAVESVRHEGLAFFQSYGLADHWNLQFLLSLLARALLIFSSAALGTSNRWWFFRLAARAAAQCVRLVGRAEPKNPQRIDVTTLGLTAPAPAQAGTAIAGDAGALVSGVAGGSVVSPSLIDPRHSSRRVGSLYSTITKVRICHRLGPDWAHLADYFEVPPYERARFRAGREPDGLWEWLERRGRLDQMGLALRLVDRRDLAEILDGDL